MTTPSLDELHRQHGVATRRQLTATGKTQSEIDAAVAAQRWQRINSLVIVCHNGPSANDNRHAGLHRRGRMESGSADCAPHHRRGRAAAANPAASAAGSAAACWCSPASAHVDAAPAGPGRGRAGAVRGGVLDAVFKGTNGRYFTVEIDGGVHLNVSTRWKDTSKDNWSGLARKLVLRFASFAIYTDDAEAVAQIRLALEVVSA
jgi:hypothetical protein